jgi:preprotein translocase subunit SecD
VFFSRGLVNLWYGRQKKLKAILIGQVWTPGGKSADVPQPDEDDDRVVATKRPGAAR